MENSEWWTSKSPLSMVRWLSLLTTAETTRLVLGGHVMYLKWSGVCWMFQYLGGSVGSSPWRALHWFIFLLILGGRNIGPWIMQASDLCTIFPQHSQIIFCLMRRSFFSFFRSGHQGSKAYSLWGWCSSIPEHKLWLPLDSVPLLY